MNKFNNQEELTYQYEPLLEDKQQLLPQKQQQQSSLSNTFQPILPLNSKPSPTHQNRFVKKLQIFPLSLLPILTINFLFSKICSVLPSNFLPLIWILHLTDTILSLVLVVISSDLEKTSKQQPIKIGNWHTIILVAIFKYINIVNNNIYQQESNRNIIHDNILLQLAIATLYYTAYCYSTGHCDIGKTKYAAIISCGFGITALYLCLYVNVSDGTEPEITGDSIQLVGVFCYCAIVLIYKALAPESTTLINATPPPNPLHLYPIHNPPNTIPTNTPNTPTNPNYSQYVHRLIFLVFTLGYVIVLTTPHCHANWYYMLILGIGVSVGGGHHRSLRYIGSRYLHLVLSISIIYITVYSTTLYFRHTTPQTLPDSSIQFSSCYNMIQLYNFHLSLILALSLSYIYLTLEQYTMTSPHTSKNQYHNYKICKILIIIAPQTVIDAKNQKNKNNSSNICTNNTNDKYYTSSIQILKLLLITLSTIQCLTAYTMYSYLSYNPDTKYILTGTGPLIMVVLLFYTSTFIQKYQMYTTCMYIGYEKNKQRKDLQLNEDEYDEKLEKYRNLYSYQFVQMVKKVIIGIHVLMVLKYLYTIGLSYYYNIINQNGSILNHLSNNVVVNVLFPKCQQLQHYYHIYFNICQCYSISFFPLFSSNSIINTLQSISILTMSSLTTYTTIFPIDQMLNSPKFPHHYRTYLTLYITTIISLYLTILYAICQWQCMFIQYWTINYAEVVLIWIYLRDVKLAIRYNTMKQKEKEKQNDYLVLERKYRIWQNK